MADTWKTGTCKECSSEVIVSPSKTVAKDYDWYCSNIYCCNRKAEATADIEQPAWVLIRTEKLRSHNYCSLCGGKSYGCKCSMGHRYCDDCKHSWMHCSKHNAIWTLPNKDDHSINPCTLCRLEKAGKL
jgi:hypothetical protein